ncbi:MAG TPA: leucine-rich repeat domain-containing protein, partial [Spirochaetota bacterium]|nr:leucine-rich repeat domain-containing protein [Spirochaetota bacterium]
SVTTVSNGAFYRCSSLLSVSLGNNISRIHREAFTYCSSLVNITIPTSVSEIHYYSFANCSSLQNVTINKTSPPTAVDNGAFWSAFNGNDPSRKIYVPAGSVTAYQTASYWSNYAADIESQ